MTLYRKFVLYITSYKKICVHDKKQGPKRRNTGSIENWASFELSRYGFLSFKSKAKFDSVIL